MAPRIPGGLGAIGECKVTQFHPTEPLRVRFGNDYHAKFKLTNCRIIGKLRGRATGRGRETALYRVTHDAFEGQEFLVNCHGFKCTAACPNPADVFEDERQIRRRPQVRRARDQNAELREFTEDVNPSVRDDGRSLNSQEIQELRDQGITGDDDDEALPENAAGENSSNITPGQWKDLRHCRREASQTNSKLAGNWKSHSSLHSFSVLRR